MKPIIRVAQGNATKLDGPFAETKELIGGFFVIDCKDDGDAAARAAKIAVDERSWIDVYAIGLWHPK